MKKIIISFSLLFIILCVFALETPMSSMYSNSFLQRSEGVNSIYWNPANLSLKNGYVTDFVILNTCGGIRNNSFSLKTYNNIVGKYLTDDDKHDILDPIDKSLNFNGNMSIIWYSIAFKNSGYSFGTHIKGAGKISKKYLELIFLGNEYNKDYVFTKDNNDGKVLAFSDFTYTISKRTLDEYLTFLKKYDIPDINVGFSLSFLAGMAAVEVQKFDGKFVSNDRGMSLDQKVQIRYGLGGYGFKGLIGLSTKPMDNLSIGLAADNLIGFIKWVGKTETKTIKANIDSVYISEIDEDILSDTVITKSVDNFETTLPFVIRFGSLYKLFDERLSLSLDYEQSIKNSAITSSKPKISTAAEYMITSKLPVRVGLTFGNSVDNYKVIYSLGYYFDHAEVNWSIGSTGDFFPSESANGITSAFSVRFKY